MTLSCSHRPPCPGCPHLGRAGLSAAVHAELLAWCAELSLPAPTLHEGNATGYRVRSRLSVRGRSSNPKAGLFREGSHDLVDIPSCLVHHPLINEVAAALKRAMVDTAAAPYAESAHRGLVRALQVVVERASRQAQVTLVLNSERFEDGFPLAEVLEQKLGSSLHSLFLNLNPKRTNVLLGNQWLLHSGPPALQESLGGAEVFFPPGAFGQANLDLFEQILAEIHEQVPAGARVAEFYAGVGAIGLGLVARSRSYAFNEVGVDSLRGLALGISSLPEAAQQNVQLHAGRAGLLAAISEDADVAIVDPPRKGLDRELLEAWTQSQAQVPEVLLYLSCHLDTLRSDAAQLRRRYRVTRVSGYALFPHTDHVETLVRFERI